jgi:hypothetical protein
MIVTDSIRTDWQAFHVKFQEHFRDFKYGNGKSKFSQRPLDNKHFIGSMEDIMEILNITRTGSMMNTLQRFHIYNETKLDNHIRDKYTENIR